MKAVYAVFFVGGVNQFNQVVPMKISQFVRFSALCS